MTIPVADKGERGLNLRGFMAFSAWSVTFPRIITLVACFLTFATGAYATARVAAANDPLPKSSWKATASGVQAPEFSARNAIDGRDNTRWSSPFSDPQWLRIDTGSECTLSGFMIRWESAYSSAYQIDVSLDGRNWETVYETDRGDGNTDYIFIEPVRARFFRIMGLKRATGWGHSLWEVDAWGLSGQPRIAASGEAAERLMDGSMDTVWQADSASARIEIDLRRPVAFGGVRIDWGDEFATHLDMSLSRDGEEWMSTPGIVGGIGVYDITPMDPVEARFIRMEIRETQGGKPAEIRQIGLRGPDERLTPLAEYQMAARKSRPGWYPEHLHGRQTYWTVVGLPKDHRVSLLDEYGNVEPFKDASTLMPYVWMDGALHSALDAEQVVQTMADDYLPLPAVNWQFSDWTLNVETITGGSTNDSVTYVRYALVNESKENRVGRLFLAMRPVQINPPWQHGGMAPIRAMHFEQTGAGLAARLNDTYSYVSLTNPDAVGALPFRFGDVIHHLATGNVPETWDGTDPRGLMSGAFAYEYDVGPGETFYVVVAVPLHDEARHLNEFNALSAEMPGGAVAAFDIQRETMRQFWKARLGDVGLELPNRDVANTVRSQIAYILINMAGDAIQPGARNYNRTWIRDGSITATALMRMGLAQDARVFLEWYAKRVTNEGLVPPILNNDGTVYTGFGSNLEYDSQGQFVHVITEYYRMTKDRAFVERHFDAIVRALQFQQELRERTLAPNYMAGEPARDRFVGILPKSISHEGYDPPRHSYWDNFWALRGWQDGAFAARLLGRKDIEQWSLEQYELLKEGVLNTIQATVKFKRIKFIPGAAELGDFDATSTAIGFEPCRIAHILPQDLLRNTFDMYYENLLTRFEPDWSGQYTPYEARSIMALVELGHVDRANVLLDYLIACRRPSDWNHLGEVVLGGYRVGGYIGDMPHTWVGSDLVNSVRGMLISERDRHMVLLSGVTEGWLTDGEAIRLRKMPTHFGALTLTATMEENRFNVALEGSFDKLEGITLRWPRDETPSDVTVDGEAWTDFDHEWCHLPADAREITAVW